jgi:CheY-like chemotaxis protein
VLLAEDNPVNQRITHLLLRRMGHLVDIVGDGLEAVDAVAQTSYDVVLMDVQMPRLDGLAAARAIRSRGSQHQPPIVALTGGDLDGDRAACAAAGMDAFLTKPLTLLALGTVLADLSAGGDGCLGTAVDGQGPARQAPPELPGTCDLTSREELIGRRLDELAGPDPLDEDLDLFSSILRSFVDRSPSLVDDLADAVLNSSVDAVQHQAHKLKGSAANLGGADLAGLLDHIESQSRLGERATARDLDLVRAELVELRRSLTVVARALESRSTWTAAPVPVPSDVVAGGAPR